MDPALSSYLQAIARKFSLTDDQAFEILSIALFLDKAFDEVHADIWVGSSGDCGFDGVYIDDQANTIYVFQCKNSPSLGENDLMKLEKDFEDLFVSNNSSGRPINGRLQAWVDEFKDFTKRGVVLTPKLLFIYSGLNGDPARANNRVLEARFSGRNKLPEYGVLDSADLLRRMANLQHNKRKRVDFTFRPEETNIPTYSRQALFSFIIGQIKAVSFRIEARQLCELIDREIELNRFMHTLFSENVRGFLGQNKANKRIRETLINTDQAPLFPFMNNGLTIVCESVEIPPLPQSGQYIVPVVNPVIVNGLQTSRVIYEAFKENPDLLKDVFITIKVYESRDQQLTDLITEATNTQTSINFKDQMSNKAFNNWAQVHFAARGVKYISKRGEIVRGDDLTEKLKDSINNEVVLKFWHATFNRDPHRAKTSKSFVQENIFLATKGDSNPDMNELFSGSPDSPLNDQLFTAYEIQKLVAKRRGELGTELAYEYLLHSDELVAYGIFLELERIDALREPSQKALEDAYDAVLPRLAKIVADERKKRGENYSHTKYFKGEAIVEDYLAAIS